MLQLEKDKARKAAREKRRQHKADQAARHRLKSYEAHAGDTQKAVNAYIRELRKGQPCMSCKRPWGKNMSFAGHYLSVGARRDLRFTEDNIWLQCYSCNSAKSGNATMYRLNLVQEIGEAKVVQMETVTGPSNWTVEQLNEIKKLYRTKLRALKAKNRLAG
jgi:hypothetical protein